MALFQRRRIAATTRPVEDVTRPQREQLPHTILTSHSQQSSRKDFIFSHLRRHRNLVNVLAAGIAVLLLAHATANAIVEYRQTPRYHSQKEADFRPFRFPSVEQRVKAYMSSWYLPSCSDEGRIRYQWHESTTWNTQHISFLSAPVSWWPLLLWSRQQPQQQGYYTIQELPEVNHTIRRTLDITHNVHVGRIFALDPQNLLACYKNKTGSIRFYCFDSVESFYKRSLHGIRDNRIPLLIQPSDETLSAVTNHLRKQQQQQQQQIIINPRIPHFKKVRLALNRTELDQITTSRSKDDHCHAGSSRPFLPPTQQPPQLQPILWKLNIQRHYGYLKLVPSLDRPWEDKIDKAVFRGVLTGNEYNANASDEQNCQTLPRCRLVYQYHDSPWIDAKLTSTMDRVPVVLNNIPLTGDLYWKEDMLAHKGILILEGNDVSSGLKWAMLSQSVVLMPPPTKTSFALEEFLEPWVHYIPLDSSLHDVEEKVQWMLQHTSEAKRISRRATLWIMDLVYHPDVAQEERWIQQEILRRYQMHFAPM